MLKWRQRRTKTDSNKESCEDTEVIWNCHYVVFTKYIVLFLWCNSLWVLWLSSYDCSFRYSRLFILDQIIQVATACLLDKLSELKLK